MAHRPLAELNADLRTAAAKVKVGGRYAHYKHPELPYLVTGLVILEANDEMAVVYQVEEAGEQVTFVRPLKSWLGTVRWHGRRLHRFTLVDQT